MFCELRRLICSYPVDALRDHEYFVEECIIGAFQSGNISRSECAILQRIIAKRLGRVVL